MLLAHNAAKPTGDRGQAHRALELMQDYALVVRAAEKEHATLAVDMFVRLHSSLQLLMARHSHQRTHEHDPHHGECVLTFEGAMHQV